MNEFIPSFERQTQILDLLARQGSLSVSDIVDQFSISEATARRDLETLAGEGKLQRVHGGAVSLRKAPPEPPILQRENWQDDEKKRIGRAAADLIGDGETVFLGSGTTVLEVARNLKKRKDLTVITNSLPVMTTLSSLPEITVIALGGLLRKSELSFIGHITEQSILDLRADKVIIGIHAISLEHGLTNDYLPETMTDRAILQMGQKVLIVADHTKFGSVSTVHVAAVEKIHTIITDTHVPMEFVESLRAKNVEVIVV
ncbi:MAG TPA: DeoR/GlpR family DNA-binding transcription regulator [Longilinea sp.]|nr:DeoR/GlpR family DNA-binding transcription regulator [Longilinea sp.]